ncbi:MAG: glycosyl hydrolase, partial [Limisphaerales bacterium]
MSKINRREFVARIGFAGAGLLVLQTGCVSKPGANALKGGAFAASCGEKMAAGFCSPPFDCGPWVYWFWLDVNVTREGITADLEAMKAVGIAGVLIMDVRLAGRVFENQGSPASFNGAKFGDPKWYELFQFACSEAHRLGMQINMNNDAGWCGSGGPWVTPELSMQRVVWAGTRVVGGKAFDVQLPQPQANLNFYRDIAVVAFPAPAATYVIDNLKNQTDVTTKDNIPAPAQWPTLKPGAAVQLKAVLDLSGRMEKTGRLVWDAPPGQWVILRIGHTTTGVLNHPAPAGGLGLETDKLSRKATLLQFDSLMGRIIKMIGPLAGRTLVSTHIDSWEIGSQNWTPTFRADFQHLRGYDLLPYLPVFTGQVIESLDVSERFLWDLRKTVGELLTENYAAAMREIARKHSLRLSIEAYAGEPDSDLCYGGQADEPMSECWSWGRFGSRNTVPEMTSAGHVYGRNIIGQETFTAGWDEKWLGHPAVVKDIGDWTFCEGINRFVFHRYAMQPWTNPHYAPGMCMGPWGLHYERTQTWWKMSKPWHDYVARCQYMLRQGCFVADVCYLQAEGVPQGFVPPDNAPGHPPRRPGYNYDACPAEVVLSRMEFRDGYLTLPGGMKYRVLALPESPTMTPQLLEKIQTLVDAGATIIGPRPHASPSLGGYPHCDDEVQRLAGKLWGGGRIIAGKTAAQVLASQGVKPDFECDQPMVRWTHRRADGVDIYFVANGAVEGRYPYAGRPMVANCSFRVPAGKPEFWDPETGRIWPVVVYDRSGGMTHLPIVLPSKASVFV